MKGQCPKHKMRVILRPFLKSSENNLRTIQGLKPVNKNINGGSFMTLRRTNQRCKLTCEHWYETNI